MPEWSTSPPPPDYTFLIKMTKCTSTTKAGVPCSHNARDGYTTCGKHKQVDETYHVHVCVANKPNGQPCTRQAKRQVNDEWLCGHHAAAAVRFYENEQFLDLLEVVILEIRGGADPVALQRAMAANHAEGLIPQSVYVRIMANLVMQDRHEVPAPAKPTGPATLADIAMDVQSVHTTVVSEQTNRGLEVLLAVDVDNRLYDLFYNWVSNTGNKSVLNDFKRWYAEPSCCKVNDWLYKRTFDGLLTVIFRHKNRPDLIQRLQEELQESVGMCCVGHINRLVNVMVGFDDRFAPPVPIGEILQQKIAAIAAKEISVEYKVGEAWAVFEELAIPMPDRDAWLEAF